SCFASSDVIKTSLSWSVGIIEAPDTIVGRITRIMQRMEATTVNAEEATDLVFIRDISWLFGEEARLSRGDRFSLISIVIGATPRRAPSWKRAWGPEAE